jgi:hypothetical protein
MIDEDAQTPAAEAPAPEDLAAPPAPAASPIDAAIDAWFAARIHNSPISRETPIFNYLRGEIEDLKQRIAALAKEP